MKNLRVILVAAFVALLLGGGVATAAKSLITSKDVKNNSLTSADIKNGTIVARDIKKNTITLNRLSKGTQKLIRAGGAKGDKGDKGDRGSNGANGATGATGATGASFDPTKVNAQTAQLFGFTPWYDTADTSTISFEGNAIKIAKTTGPGIAGVNLPIDRGTSFSAIESIEYTQTGKAVLAIEMYRQGGIFDVDYKGDYTTIYFTPAADGDVTTAFTTGKWFSTGAANADLNDKTWAEIKGAMGTRAARNKAIILAASIRTNNDQTDATAISATVSQVKLKLAHAATAATYGFEG